MKRLFTLFLAVAIFILLPGCGSGSSPSEDLIQTDIENALLEKNPHATITDTETVKSLENDGTYDITLQISATSQYADWEYEVDMSYTKYDQGWMLDGIDWMEENYTQSRYPDAETMQEYATEYFQAHNVSAYLNDMLPIESPILDTVYSEEIAGNALYLSWDSTKKGNFANQSCSFYSVWQYVPTLDNWVLIPDPVQGYQLKERGRIISQAESNLDFSGHWFGTLKFGTAADIPIHFEISDFSWDEFDANVEWGLYDVDKKKVNDTEKVSGHFTRVYNAQGDLEADDRHYIFSDGNNHYISITFYYDGATITYHPDATDSSSISVSITTKLPTLS